MSRKRKHDSSIDAEQKRIKPLRCELLHYTDNTHQANQENPTCIEAAIQNAPISVYLPRVCQHHLVCSAASFALEMDDIAPAVEVFMVDGAIEQCVIVCATAEKLVLDTHVEIGIPFPDQVVSITVVLLDGDERVFCTERRLLCEELIQSGLFQAGHAFDDVGEIVYLEELPFRQDLEYVFTE